MGFKVDYIKEEHNAILEFIGFKNSIVLLEEITFSSNRFRKSNNIFCYKIWLRCNDTNNIFFVGRFRKITTALKYFNKSKKDIESISITKVEKTHKECFK